MPPAPRAGTLGTGVARRAMPRWNTKVSAMCACQPEYLHVSASALRLEAPKLWYKFVFEYGRPILAGITARLH